MSETEGSLNRYSRTFLWIVVLAALVYLIVQKIGVFGNILLVIIGFGAVILIHEFGHFIIAKLFGIKVEAFSVGFPPTLIGIRRTEGGYRIRILPRFLRKEDDEPDETEYRIGLIPFGGYNKILGQEDLGPVKVSDDPRSYANKPVGVRMAVIAAGVVFNAVSAIIIFMMVFLIGINRPPAVVGGIVPNSSAAREGLKPGDEIIEIDGKSDNLDFGNIIIAAALSDVNEAVPLKVRREDGSVGDFALVAEKLGGAGLRRFGIMQPLILTIAQVSDVNELREKTGLVPGDRIKAVDGRDVQTHWELADIVENALAAEVTLLAERTDEGGKGESIEVKSPIPLDLNAVERRGKSGFVLSHIYSMVPRLRIIDVSGTVPSTKDGLVSRLRKRGIKKKVVDARSRLQVGDVILGVGDIENPTFRELRDVTVEYEEEKLPVKVLRTDANGIEKRLTVNVVPKRPRGGKRALIGIGVSLDAEHSVVAKTIAAGDWPEGLKIPRGATIEAVDGNEVSNFYDVAREINRHVGERITIDWRVDEEIAGNVALDVGEAEDFVTVKSSFAEPIPFEALQRLYQASGPIDAVAMGCKKTVVWIVRTYLTLRRIIGGGVGREELSGPVGIVAASYQIAAERPLIDLVYFLGVISVLLAVFNLLPWPPVDGGWLVLLVVEKIKGSALSERAQEIMIYAGWIFILIIFLFLTFNDIVNLFR